jgi:flagellar hook-associated protein 2
MGLGTGVNMSTLATQMAQASYAGATANVASKLNAVQVQISEASQLQNSVASLVSSFASLVNGGGLSATPSVSNSSVAAASLPVGASGATSSYSLEVDRLASPQVLASPGFSSASATTGSGTLTINFGSLSSGSFSADATKSPVNITVNQGDSLTQIAADINGAGAGVTAYVANTASGAQLVMKGPTGADNAFSVSATENSADPGLSALAANPATVGSGRLAESAVDASFSIDGIAQTSASNTIANAAPSLALQLTGTNVGNPTTISYSDPSSAISNAMQNFTTALNSIVTAMNTDMTASATGSLANDGGAQALSAKLAGLPGATIMPNAATGAPATLADLGLVVNKDNSFKLDTTKLQSALSSNPSAVAAMFTNGLYGVYGTLSDLSMAISSTTDPGSLAGTVTYYTAQQTSLTTKQNQIASEQAALQTQLINQFATANSSVATSKSTLSYLQNQIAAWNSPTGGLA